MGILLLIVPLLVYYLIIVPILKIKVINEIQSKKLKTLAFILLLLFPIGDHLIGYVVYKTLCYTKGGVYIYKTVTNEQEQRDYWIDTYKEKRPTPSKGERYGIEGRIYLTKDLKHHKTVYINNCKSKIWKSYDCQKAEKYINDNDVKIYTYNKEQITLPKNKNNNDYIKESSLKIIRLINDKELTLERAYFNYCNPKYNTLPKDHKNYKYSCINADEIIKKYSLKNVIKVPKSLYSLYSIASDKGSNREVFLFPFIGKDYQKIYNIKTGEILAEYKGFNFWGGWYINLLNPYHPSALSRCGKKNSKDLYSFKELVIPNPYKNKKKD